MSNLLDQVTYNSAAMQHVRKELVPFIDSAASILFWGETGSGMGFYAKAIHQASSRKGNFLKIPGFSLDEDTVKQQFIGVDEQPGWLEEAHNGTIFLKRISEASLPVQQILLSLIGNQSVDGRIQFSRKGRAETLEVNVRFIYSMTHELAMAIQDKLLHRDFIDMIEKRGKMKIISLPPLRKRREDVVNITQNFLEEFNTKYTQNISTIDKSAQNIFTNYIWPGNIDELKRTIESIFLQNPGITTITEEHIPEHVKKLKIKGDQYSFKFKDDVKFKGKILSPFLKIETENKKFKFNTGDLVEIFRVEDAQFAPPKFRYFVFKFKDGNQITGKILDTTMDVETPFDPSYQINPQNLYSLYLT